MNHRISAGALVQHEGRLLLVRHRKEGSYDFWVAPGGGVQGTESLAEAAEREVREETGLKVVAERLVYVEEFYQPDIRHCKFWFLAKFVGGTLNAEAPEAVIEHIVEAGWHTQAQVKSLQVFPEVLQARYWQDLSSGFPGLHHLGLRKMAFW
jgi:ADP-ribose pyrophosphatase YjhB (NUDIX family)